jgi:outer membrane receptor protein involved in Fe transport
MIHRYLIVLVCLSLGPWQFLSAQTLLRGLVYDQRNRKPLVQAQVTLLNTSLQGVSNRKGFFRVERVPPGVYKVRFSHPGYRSVIKTLKINNEPIYSAGASLVPLRLDSRREYLSAPHGYQRDPFYSPYAQSLIHIQPLEQRQALNLAEGLSQAGSFTVISPQYATPSVQLRGLGPQHLNWNYEGIPLSPSAQRPDGWLVGALIDPYELDRMEVQRGTGGLLYGQAGTAGTVHLHSQVPAFSGHKRQVHGRLLTQGQTPSSRYGGQGRLSVHLPRLAIQASGSLRQWQALQAPTLPDSLAGNGFATQSGQLTSAFQLSPKHRLTLGYRFAEQRDADLTASLRPSPWPDQRQFARHQLAFASLTGNYERKWMSKLRLVAGYQRMAEARQASRPQTAPVLATSQQMNTWSGRAEVLSNPYFFWHIVSGVSAVSDQVDSDRLVPGNIGPERRLGELPRNGSATSLGAFTLHTIDLLKLHLVIGGRVETDFRQNLGPDAAQSDWQTLQFTYNISGMYPLSKQYQVVGNLQSGYRSPSLFELSGLGPISVGIAAPADGGLTGERSFTAELGLKVGAGQVNGSLMVYRTFMRDYLGYVPGSYQGQTELFGQPVYQLANRGESYVTGLEASVEVLIGQMFSVYGSVVYAYGEALQRSNPLPGVPPINGRLGGYFRQRLGIWSRVEWRFATTQTRLSPLDEVDPAIGPNGLPAWNLIDLQAGYDVGWGQVGIGVYNLLNAYAQPWGAAIPQAGRQVSGSVEVSF